MEQILWWYVGITGTFMFAWLQRTEHVLLRIVLWVIDLCFIDVQMLSTDQLAALPLESYLLLDVRSREEFDVSHLPFALDFLPDDTPSDAVIVVYCSIGWRSSLVARQLRKAGFPNSYNLRGSLFLWVLEGRSLDGTNPSRGAFVVHPFNTVWGNYCPPT